MSTTVGMDVDFNAPEGLSAEERQAWLQQQMARVPELVLEKKDELGLLMLERSATKGYHLVFRRREELSQEENLKWASRLLGVKYDEGAKDITRVFFTTSDSEEDLIYLDDEVFEIGEANVNGNGNGNETESNGVRRFPRRSDNGGQRPLTPSSLRGGVSNPEENSSNSSNSSNSRSEKDSSGSGKPLEASLAGV